mmetsp:Transcript_12488/g.18679  ORF Transcript_12488/g.18679 Transcript_12488/m.18679 type:complete len:209 (-) Transcript_12488:47-673(-)
MRIVAGFVYKYKNVPDNKPIILTSDIDVSFIGYFTQGMAKEAIMFVSRQIAERSKVGMSAFKEKANNETYSISSVKKTNGLVGVVITDTEYPLRVCVEVNKIILREYEDKYNLKWEDDKYASDHCLENTEALKATLKKYANPEEADDIMKIKDNLNETKKIMHESLNSLYEKEESLQELAKQSSDLSYWSKTLLDQSEGLNDSCCVIS